MASTSWSTSAVERASTTAPSAPAAAHRSRAACGSRAPPHPVVRLVAQPVGPLEADDDELVLAPPPRLRDGLEIQRQIRLEVLVERCPAVADAPGQARAGPRLSADEDRRHGIGHRIRRRVTQRIEIRLA